MTRKLCWCCVGEPRPNGQILRSTGHDGQCTSCRRYSRYVNRVALVTFTREPGWAGLAWKNMGQLRRELNQWPVRMIDRPARRFRRKTRRSKQRARW